MRCKRLNITKTPSNTANAKINQMAAGEKAIWLIFSMYG